MTTDTQFQATSVAIPIVSVWIPLASRTQQYEGLASWCAKIRVSCSSMLFFCRSSPYISCPEGRSQPSGCQQPHGMLLVCRFFPIFFAQKVNLSPVAVNILMAAQPIVIGCCATFAQWLSRYMGGPIASNILPQAFVYCRICLSLCTLLHLSLS